MSWSEKVLEAGYYQRQFDVITAGRQIIKEKGRMPFVVMPFGDLPDGRFRGVGITFQLSDEAAINREWEKYIVSVIDIRINDTEAGTPRLQAKRGEDCTAIGYRGQYRLRIPAGTIVRCWRYED